jgi:intracellular multiplication protein IcmL
VKTEDIVTTILMRERYRRDRLEYLMRMFAIVCAMLAFVVVSDVLLMRRGPGYRFVMTDPAGKILDLVPLTKANKTDEEVADWTTDSVTRIFTFDFANYRRQFQVAQNLLSSAGWDGFYAMLMQSGNFKSVVANRYVTTASPSGSAKAKVISSGILRDANGHERFGWTVELPIVILFQNQKQQTSLNITVRATVVRMPEYINEQGLGIRMMLAR